MIANFLRFIRFSHTIFALPFALGSMFVAAHGLPSWQIIALILLAMVFARTAAMTFNRIADWEIDKRNPRTVGRHKLLPKNIAILACVISTLLFFLTTYFINPLCFALSPVALIVILGYSYAKRFTNFAQFVLGLALAIAPVGAWLAVTGQFAAPPLILAAAVLMWTAGFDIIYATQDYEVDKREGLRSIVVWLGLSRALTLAVVLHTAALFALAGFGLCAALGTAYFIALALMTGALVYEHLLAHKGDVGAINAAFFQANAAVGLFFVIGTLVDQLLR
jgi:4-hydroxybenzoate polyprenyltransferase